MTGRGLGARGWWQRIALGSVCPLMLAFARPVTLSAQQKVPLVVHHLIATIDSATYDDVAGSQFLGEMFAAVERGSLSGPDGGRGIRIMGKYNFLQLRRAALPHDPDGGIKIVLSSERPGGLEQLSAQGPFASLLPGERSIVTHEPTHDFSYDELSNRLRPSGADSTSDRAGFEVLQYTPAAAARQFTVDSLPATRLANSRFLSRFYDSNRLLAYLTGATLAIPVDDIAKIARVLRRDGVVVLAEGEGAIIELDGFTLHLIPPWSGAGVRQLKFALTRDVPANPVYTFGPHSRLRFGPGPIAAWDFNSR